MLKATNIPISLQALSPKSARFCLGIERFLLELWGEDVDRGDLDEAKKAGAKNLEGKRVAVGLSGGADSLALLLVLFYLQKRLGITLEAVHIHHALRTEADKEAEAVGDFCKTLGIDCLVHRADVPSEAEKLKIGIEEAGRMARYKVFDSLAMQDETWIALGHHTDDLCEDVLMRLIRGAGWPALGGMTGFDAKRRLVRPLLGTKRADIEAFLVDLGLSWVNDASNASLDYRRNRIRHNVMPLLIEENPALHETVLSLWKLARIDERFWRESLQKLIEQAVAGQVLSKQSMAGHTLDRDVLRTLAQAQRLRLYKMMLDSLGTGQASVTTLLALDDAWTNQRGGLAFQFNGNKIASISRGTITFSILHPHK